MKKIAVGDLGEFWYGDYKEPFVQLEGAVPGYPQGVVLKADDGKLLCAYCGKVFDNLGLHAKHRHGMDAAAYKRESGLLQGSALVSDRVRMQIVAGAVKMHRRHPERLKGLSVDGRKLAMEANRGVRRSPTRTPEYLNKTGRCYAQVLGAGKAVLRDYGRVNRSLMQKRGIGPLIIETYFGDWDGFRSAVGASPLGRRTWTVPQLLAVLKSLADKLGRTPSQSDLRRYGMPTDKAFRRAFGSWTDACLSAGLDPNLPVPMSEQLEVQTLVAYATHGNIKKAGSQLGISPQRIAGVLHRYGYPFSFASRHNYKERREWAGEMARRLSDWPEQVAA